MRPKINVVKAECVYFQSPLPNWVYIPKSLLFLQLFHTDERLVARLDVRKDIQPVKSACFLPFLQGNNKERKTNTHTHFIID